MPEQNDLPKVSLHEMTANWKCEDCGWTTSVDYEELAQIGTPTCCRCNIELTLLREEAQPVDKPGERRYVLYDFDMDNLATTHVYGSYDEAAEDAVPLNNVIIVPLVFRGERQEEVPAAEQ